MLRNECTENTRIINRKGTAHYVVNVSLSIFFLKWYMIYGGCLCELYLPPVASPQRKSSLLQLSANEMTPAVQVVAALGWKLWFWHFWQCILMSCGRGFLFCHDVQLLQWENTIKTGVSETTLSLICHYIFCWIAESLPNFVQNIIFEVNVVSVCMITFLRRKA